MGLKKKVDLEGFELAIWDKKKQLLFLAMFSSDENSFVAYFKLVNENKLKPLYLKSDDFDNEVVKLQVFAAGSSKAYKPQNPNGKEVKWTEFELVNELGKIK